MIAIIKLKQKEEIRKELLQEIQNKTIEKHNETIEQDDRESEMELLIAENTLLKKLVTELEDKNQVQKELIELQKQKCTEIQPSKKSYADVIRDIKPKQKRVPKITIKNRDPKQKNIVDLLKNCTNCIVAEKSIQTRFIREKNDTEIEISCMNSTSVDAAELVLNSNLENCEIKIEQQGNPKIKIIGIDNPTSMKEEEMQEDINKRNFSQFGSGGKILHMYVNKRNKTVTVLMEITSEIYKFIRENGNKIFVGHQRCKIYDLINLNPCYNCARYGHNASKCNNDSVCIKCSEEHNVNECKNNKIECANCVYNNAKYRTNLTTDHLPTDRIKCSILRKKIKKYIDSTDYPIAPVLPAWDESSALREINNWQANNLHYQRKTKTVKSIVEKITTSSLPHSFPSHSTLPLVKTSKPTLTNAETAESR